MEGYSPVSLKNYIRVAIIDGMKTKVKPDTRRNIGMSEAAGKLKLSIPRVKQIAKQGRIGEMIAGRYLFSEAELSAFSAIKRESGRPKSSSCND